MHAVLGDPRLALGPPSSLVSPLKDRQQQPDTMQTAQLSSVARVAARPVVVSLRRRNPAPTAALGRPEGSLAAMGAPWPLQPAGGRHIPAR